MPSASNTAGPIYIFSAPRVTDNAKISNMDNLVVARISSLIMYWANSGYSLAKKDAVQPTSPSNILLVLS